MPSNRKLSAATIAALAVFGLSLLGIWLARPLESLLEIAETEAGTTWLRQLLSTLLVLAAAQLVAYNAKDLDAFCACYADDVRVLDAEGTVTLQGSEPFRARYAELFGGWDEVRATVSERLVLEPHTIDFEAWWRSRPGERQGGQVLVRYTARDGRIALVEFLREDA
jgi:hypothetical protein